MTTDGPDGGRPMNVALLLDTEGRPRFFSVGTRDARMPRGRIGRWARGAQAALLRSSRRLGPTTRKIRDRLNAWTESDEPLLAGLRDAQSLRLEHPTRIGPDQVLSHWQAYLRRRRRGQTRRLLIDLALSPLTLILAPIPGPNFVGYWFAYRAYRHGTIVVGIQRALSDAIPRATVSRRTFDRVLSEGEALRLAQATNQADGRGFPSRLAEILGVPGSDEFGPEIATQASRTPRPAWLAAVPNALTILSLGLAIAFPFLPERTWLSAILIALATELLDGFLARRLGVTSAIGHILDPIADKAFVLSVLAVLLQTGILERWMIALLLLRDGLVMAGVVVLAIRRGWGALRRLPPSFLGKLTTASQFATLISAVALKSVPLPMLILTAMLGSLAGIDYVRRYR